MAPPTAEALQGRRLLVVEDEYILAMDLAHSLEDQGAEVIGPAGAVAPALALLASSEKLDAAVLDINLGGTLVYPVVDALRERGVPCVFVTGYSRWVGPEAYANIPRLEKPVELRALARALSAAWAA